MTVLLSFFKEQNTRQAISTYSPAKEQGCVFFAFLEGVEVDWHSNLRPNHEFMQGKQFVLGKARTINGVSFESADEALKRLNDYGCLHFKTPIICGVSEPRYSPEDLKRLNEQNAKTYDFNDKKMSGYEASQAMRRLETEVKKQKGIRELARASGDKALVKRCNERIKVYKEKCAEISQISGINKAPDRINVTKKVGNTPESLTLSGNGSIIKSNQDVGRFAQPYPDGIIPNNVKSYLSELKEYGDEIPIDKPLTFEEISLMSRQAGVEFASVTVEERHYIIRGNERGTYISVERLEDMRTHRGILNCHSHPYIGDLQPSSSDIELACIMDWQDEFVIVTPDMRQSTYSKAGISSIKNVTSNMSDERRKIFDELFGGDNNDR